MSMIFSIGIPNETSFITVIAYRNTVYNSNWSIRNDTLFEVLPDDSVLLISEDTLEVGQIEKCGLRNIKTMKDLRKAIEEKR